MSHDDGDAPEDGATTPQDEASGEGLADEHQGADDLRDDHADVPGEDEPDAPEDEAWEDEPEDAGELPEDEADEPEDEAWEDEPEDAGEVPADEVDEPEDEAWEDEDWEDKPEDAEEVPADEVAEPGYAEEVPADEADAPQVVVVAPYGEEASEEERDRKVPAFLLGLLVGLAVLALVWVSVAVLTDDPADVTDTANQLPVSQTRDAATPSGSPSPSTPPAEAGPTPMERCVAAADAMAPPLEAAQPAMDQWEIHVGAMNKLVVGAITFQQASDFWNQTRLGAQRRIARFRDADGSLRRHGVDCAPPQLLPPGSAALRSCSRQIQADLETLRVARIAIDTWDQHVHDMDMLRLGTLSPEKATAMWLSMWKQGVRQLESYRLAARDMKQQGACGSEDNGESASY
jgi:hypothetical protein